MLLNANVAHKDDLGMDFGSGKSTAPDCDKDLEAECNPKAIQNRSEKKQMVKDGIDHKIKSSPEGDFFEEQDIGGGD